MFGYAIEPGGRAGEDDRPAAAAAIRCGTAALAVCQTPVRLMSIMSRHSSSVSLDVAVGEAGDAGVGGDDVEPAELRRRPSSTAALSAP